MGESDRGVVLLGAAWIDDALGELMESYFVDSRKLASELLRFPGPISNFAARTTLAAALGLITEEERHDIDLVRRIRNDAAHVAKAVNFSDEASSLVQRCAEFHTFTEKTKASYPEPRRRFLLAVAWLVVKIEAARENLVRCVAPSEPSNMATLSSRAVALTVMTEMLVEKR
jgi:DNA-binding MltR family transcriptional regulator